jgi:hypothetical protein
MSLLTIRDEPNVSGEKSLGDGQGSVLPSPRSSPGQADVVAAAYFDRFFGSLARQAEVVERVPRRARADRGR